jgi:hypothetical protein
MTSLCGLLAMLIAGRLMAGDYFYEQYNWQDSTQLNVLEGAEADELAIILNDSKVIEYYHDNKYNTLLQYYTVHSRVRVNSNDAVELYNKEYIATGRVVEIMDLRARVITADGVSVIDEIDLKDYEGSDEYSSYKYFAIEGVEIGSEVEYIYTLKMLAKLDGSREFFQSQEPRHHVAFQIIAPDDMFFATKSYNGFAEVQYDTTDNKNVYVAEMTHVPALKPEPYAPYTDNLMRVEYKLDYMAPSKEIKLYTYDQLSNQLHKYLKQELGRKDEKKLASILKDLKIDGLSDHAKIRTIEDYVKGVYTIVDDSNDEFEDVSNILEKKYCNNRGAIKLFVALFDIEGIDYRYGLTSDRSTVKLDPDFESYSFLENYIFYFPSVDAYMAPTEVLFRLGYIPYNWSNNYGLFVKSVVVGELAAGVGEVKFIEPLPYEQNQDVLEINVAFMGEFDAVNLDITRRLTGYNATFIQPIFNLIPEKESKMVVNELLNLAGKDVDVNSTEVLNKSLDSLYLEPFIVKGSFSTANSFFAKAGNRYLFNIGEVIGQQVEMYQEEERTLPVENDFNRQYLRKITIRIPDGYAISNLEELKFEIFHEKDGARCMSFVSDYEKKDNVLVVSINEYYKELTYSVEDFAEFKNVINAAADFNKKVLIFEKSI